MFAQRILQQVARQLGSLPNLAHEDGDCILSCRVGQREASFRSRVIEHRILAHVVPSILVSVHVAGSPSAHIELSPLTISKTFSKNRVDTEKTGFWTNDPALCRDLFRSARQIAVLAHGLLYDHLAERIVWSNTQTNFGIQGLTVELYLGIMANWSDFPAFLEKLSSLAEALDSSVAGGGKSH
jgi:hypothetical protein